MQSLSIVTHAALMLLSKNSQTKNKEEVSNYLLYEKASIFKMQTHILLFNIVKNITIVSYFQKKYCFKMLWHRFDLVNSHISFIRCQKKKNL